MQYLWKIEIINCSEFERVCKFQEKANSMSLLFFFLFFPKDLVSNLTSTKEELMKLRQILRLLRLRCTENDGICLLKIVSALWEKWLSLLEAAKEWEMWCEELKQEWKFVSEEVSASFSTNHVVSNVLLKLFYYFHLVFL